ncbi:MAG: VanZ family protein [Butyricicoccaceae bacterium]
MNRNRKTPAEYVIWIAFILYLLLLYKAVLFKFPLDTILSILRDESELWVADVNLHPFTTIRMYLSGRAGVWNAVRNLGGNILVFAPMGIFIPLLRKKLAFPTTFFTALAISGSIELIQYKTGLGSCDIDDVILNVFGAMLFCLLLVTAEWGLPLLRRLGNGLLELIRMLLRPLFGYPMRPKATKTRAKVRKNCAKKSSENQRDPLDKPKRMR